MNHPTPFHRRSADAGFTIIELMIVLGIAALILAGVLIAVPALQRNQRNNNRRADISYVQARIVQFQGDNQGAMPDSDDDMAVVTGSDDDSTFYAATNSWDVAGDWELEAGTTGADGAADEYNIWVDAGDAADVALSANFSDPGDGDAAGGDPLPDEDHFDVFVGYSCASPTLAQPRTVGGTPADIDNYPNGGDADTPTYAAAGTVANIFVDEAGPSRGYAIVYKLEAQDVWRCIDNS